MVAFYLIVVMVVVVASDRMMAYFSERTRMTMTMMVMVGPKVVAIGEKGQYHFFAARIGQIIYNHVNIIDRDSFLTYKLSQTPS